MGLLNYKINTASQKDIEEHLYRSSHLFNPPLDSILNITDYADKIRDKATTIEAWSSEYEVVGLIACYMNDDTTHEAFITNVSVDEKFQHQGIASELLRKTIIEVQKKGFLSVRLEVEEVNDAAIRLYKKFAFVQMEKKGSKYIMTAKIE